MRLLSQSAIPVLVISAVAALPRTAAAEPIAITSGYVETEVISGRSQLHVEGNEFLLTAWVEALVTTLGFGCIPCEPGTTLDLAGAIGGSRAAGSAVVDGVSYPEIFFDGMTGTFSSPSFQISGAGDVTVSRDFTFSGLVSGYLINPFVTASEPVFTKSLSGQGTATATFLYNDSDIPLFWASSLRYDFTDAAPVPEPATLVLFGTGAAIAALRRRRAHRA